ncbi:MAG: glycosyltransferase [Bdellovibrionota bacterium]
MLNTNTTPLISVVIPVYNGAKYVEQTIQSVLEQSHKDFELLIVNDGSTDSTQAILEKYKTNPQVQIFTKTNGGLSSARNLGIQSARGEFISLLDADDLWESTKLEAQVKKIKELDNDFGIIYTDCNYVDTKDQLLPNESEYYHLDTAIKGNVYEKLIVKNQICGSGSAVLIPKKVFDAVGLFDENLKSCEDQDMWLRITKKYPVAYVNQRLVKIRVHPQSMQRNHDRMFLYSFVVLAKQLSDPQYRSLAMREIETMLNGQLTLKRWNILKEYSVSEKSLQPLLNKKSTDIAKYIAISYSNRIKRKLKIN